MSDDLTKPAPDEPEAPTTLPGDLDTPATPTPLPAPPAGRGVTAHGWPYVEPDDHPLQYPNVSQALAEKLEAESRPVRGRTQGFTTDPAGLIIIPTGLPGVSSIVAEMSWAGTEPAIRAVNPRIFFVTNDAAGNCTMQVTRDNGPTPLASNPITVSWIAVQA
jgi:hypothetical protein